MQSSNFILIKTVASTGCVTEKQELLLILRALFYFYLYGRLFTKHSETVTYFVFLILFIGILLLIKVMLIKIPFFHFISLNITILLCFEIANLDCNKILMSISQLYHLTISSVKNNGQ